MSDNEETKDSSSEYSDSLESIESVQSTPQDSVQDDTSETNDTTSETNDTSRINNELETPYVNPESQNNWIEGIHSIIFISYLVIVDISYEIYSFFSNLLAKK